MSPGSHWRPAYIGLGSNLQMPARQVDEAFELLAEIEGSRLVHRSSLYRSTPFGGIEQPDFVNAAAAVLTTLEPSEFFAELQAIEKRTGQSLEGTPYVGDSLKDIRAAEASSCTPILVLTGNGQETLQSRPDLTHVYEDLGAFAQAWLNEKS